MKSPEEIVELMMENDAFSQWMGIEVIALEKGHCQLNCTVHEHMLNGFQILHGGISYSLSDSALAFAANSYGNKCMSIETSISHLRKVELNDMLIITCNEISRRKTIGIYSVSIKKTDGTEISRFKGTVHISAEIW
ncbi:MAG: PaaI family thioesterase [Crocinitomicaceae bacterium]